MPVNPPATRWRLPEGLWNLGSLDPDDDLVAVGADLAPGTLLAAYSRGLFPMPSTPDAAGPPYWYCPVRRGVLPLEGPNSMVVSRSLRRSARSMEIRVNTAFEEVIEGCADPRRPWGWIDRGVVAAYTELHRLGWAHSVEAWRGGELVGGLYGVAIGGLFAGESMFYRATDASKVALLGLVELLRDEHAERRVLDVQWRTDHLATLGVVELSREEYAARLRRALDAPLPRAFES